MRRVVAPLAAAAVGVVAIVVAVTSPGGGTGDPSRPTPQAATPTRTGDPARPTPTGTVAPSRRDISDAVRLELGEDLQAVVDRHPPGTTFVIAAGVHRMEQLHPRAGDVFIGEPGAVLSGARVLEAADFTRDGDVWVIGGQDQEGAARGKFLEGYERDAHPEDLFVDGRRLRHVPHRRDIEGPSDWHFDYARDEIIIEIDPASVGRIETSVSEAAFHGAGVPDVTIQNLAVRHYATPSQRGAINGRQSIRWTIRSVDASSNHAYGLGTGPGMLVEHSRFADNGQAGVGGPGERHRESPVAAGEVRPIRILSNEIAHNRALGYNWRWEGGGTKFTLTSRMVFANNHVHGNGGPGLWWDIDNEDPTGCANLVEANVVGIFPEIGQGARIAWNQVHDNIRPGEEDASTGIYVSNTTDVEIWENAVSGQLRGILARAAEEGERGDHGPRVTTGLHVHGNLVAFDDHSGVRIETQRPASRQTTRFEDNHWFVPDVGGRFWILGDDDDPMDFEAWQAQGMDRSGRVSSLRSDQRPALPDGVPRFTPTPYGPLEEGEARPVQPPAAACAGAMP